MQKIKLIGNTLASKAWAVKYNLSYEEVSPIAGIILTDRVCGLGDVSGYVVLDMIQPADVSTLPDSLEYTIIAERSLSGIWYGIVAERSLSSAPMFTEGYGTDETPYQTGYLKQRNDVIKHNKSLRKENAVLLKDIEVLKEAALALDLDKLYGSGINELCKLQSKELRQVSDKLTKVEKNYAAQIVYTNEIEDDKCALVAENVALSNAIAILERQLLEAVKTYDAYLKRTNYLGEELTAANNLNAKQEQEILELYRMKKPEYNKHLNLLRMIVSGLLGDREGGYISLGTDLAKKLEEAMNCFHEMDKDNEAN